MGERVTWGRGEGRVIWVGGRAVSVAGEGRRTVELFRESGSK